MSSEASALSAAVKPLLAPLARGESLRTDALESVFHVLVAHVEQLTRSQHALHARLQRLFDAVIDSDDDHHPHNPPVELTQPPHQLQNDAENAPRPIVTESASSPREQGDTTSLSTRLKRRRRKSRRPLSTSRTPLTFNKLYSPHERSDPHDASPLRPQQLDFQATSNAPPSSPPPPLRASQQRQSPPEDIIPPQRPGSAALHGFRTPAAVDRAVQQELRRQRLRDTPLVQQRRARADQTRLRATACVQCEPFFRAEAAAHDDPQQAYERLVQSACRHRREVARQSTPDDFWQLTFEETETQPP